jgi:hypothetical protein
MHRFLATFFVIAFSWLLVLPVFAVSSPSNLPACCRNNGKHHCQMKPVAGFSAVGERCPFYQQSSPISPFAAYQAASSPAIFAGLVAHPALCPQTEAGYRASQYRSRQKRGPPALLS